MAGKYHPPKGHNGPDHAKSHDNLLGQLIDNVCYSGEVHKEVSVLESPMGGDWDDIEEPKK